MPFTRKLDRNGKIVGGEISVPSEAEMIINDVQGIYHKTREELDVILVHLKKPELQGKDSSRWLAYTCGQNLDISARGEAHPAGEKVLYMENITVLQHTPNNKYCIWIPPHGPWIWMGPC